MSGPRQLEGDLSSALRKLVDVKVERGAALQAQEGAVAAPLEDRLGRQDGCLAVEHQQVSIQEPANTVQVRLECFGGNVQR